MSPRTMLAAAVLVVAAAGLLMPLEAQQIRPRPNFLMVDPVDPPGQETCDPAKVMEGYVEPVSFLVEHKSRGRLMAPLRAAARGSSANSMTLAAAAFAMSRDPSSFPHGRVTKGSLGDTLRLAMPPLKGKSGQQRRRATATAFADLAVSGRRAYAEYKKAPPTQADLFKRTTALLKDSGVPASDIERGARQAIARAKRVADYFALVPHPTWIDG